MDLQSALNNLYTLKHKGIITAEEYKEQKKRLLAHSNDSNDSNNPAIQPTEIIPCDKSRNIYILLAFLLGSLGVHNFYAARIKRAIGQIVLLCLFFLIFPLFILAIWVFVDMLIIKTDGKGHLMTPINQWGIILITLEALRFIIGLSSFGMLIHSYWPTMF